MDRAAAPARPGRQLLKNFPALGLELNEVF